jgi:hypothetical protein
MTRDIAASSRALIESGFEFQYPGYREGLPPSIDALGPLRTQTKPSILDRRGVFVALSVLAIGAFLAENRFTFPLSVPYMRNLAAGAAILDMRPGYTPDAAYQLFDALGRPGRDAYLTLLWTVDLLLPALFGGFLSAAIRCGAFRSWSRVPLLGAACDYAENFTITLLLLRYPEHRPVGVYVAATLTCVKQALYASGVLLSVAGVLTRFLRIKSRHA